MGVLLPGVRDDSGEFILDRVGGLGRGQAGAVGNPEDMGVDGDGGLAEGGVDGVAQQSGKRVLYMYVICKQ